MGEPRALRPGGRGDPAGDGSRAERGPGRAQALLTPSAPSVSRQVAALDLDNVYMKYMLVVLALVMVGHLVVRRFFRP